MMPMTSPRTRPARCAPKQPQGAGLVADKLVDADEFEAVAERAAVLLDRLPLKAGSGVTRIDYHHAFEVRIVKTRHWKVERQIQHIRRFAARPERGSILWARRHRL